MKKIIEIRRIDRKSLRDYISDTARNMTDEAYEDVIIATGSLSVTTANLKTIAREIVKARGEKRPSLDDIAFEMHKLLEFCYTDIGVRDV